MNQMDANYFWKSVVDTIQDGVMIVNPEGVIISINRAFEEITGYKPSEIIGQSCDTLGCTSCNRARLETEYHWCTVFRTGQLKRLRCSLTHKNGHIVHILKNASVLKDQDGTIIGAVETMTDISDLVEKENQLKVISGTSTGAQTTDP